MRFTILESLLREDIESTRKQYPHIPDEDFDKILRLDPTFDDSSNKVGDYGNWMLGKYNKDNPLNYDPQEVYSTLSAYDKYKKDRAVKIEKDINKFKKLQDFKDAVSNIDNAPVEQSKDYEIVAEDGEWAIFKIYTHTGARKLGKSSGWCTALENPHHYDNYLTAGGNYYVIMNKENRSEKYQIHFETAQCFKSGNGSHEIQVNGNKFLQEHPLAYDYFKSIGYDVDDFNSNRTEYEIDWDEVGEILFERRNNGTFEQSISLSDYIDVASSDSSSIDSDEYTQEFIDLISVYGDVYDYKSFATYMYDNFKYAYNSSSSYMSNLISDIVDSIRIDEDTMLEVISDEFGVELTDEFDLILYSLIYTYAENRGTKYLSDIVERISRSVSVAHSDNYDYINLEIASYELEEAFDDYMNDDDIQSSAEQVAELICSLAEQGLSISNIDTDGLSSEECVAVCTVIRDFEYAYNIVDVYNRIIYIMLKDYKRDIVNNINILCEDDLPDEDYIEIATIVEKE